MANNFVDSISNRVENLLVLPLEICDAGVAVANTSVGVAGTVLSILTFGKSKRINTYAEETIFSAQILPKVFICVIKGLHPHANIAENRKEFITTCVAQPIFQYAHQAASHNSSFFQRHLVSRVSACLGGLVATITEVADLALGLLGTVLSVFTFGAVDKINTFTCGQLRSLRLIEVICRAARMMVNPHQFISS